MGKKSKLAGVLVCMALALTGCGSVKKVPASAEQQRQLVFGAPLSDYFEMNYTDLAGIRGVEKIPVEEYLEEMGVAGREQAVASLDWMARTGVRGADSELHFTGDFLLSIAQEKLLLTENIDPKYGRECVRLYREYCGRMSELYGVEPELFDAVETLSAFDYAELITYARLYFAVGYITEDEAWEYIAAAAAAAAGDYGGWEEYIAGFLLGNMYAGYDDQELYTAVYPLLHSEDSILRQYAFEQ